MPTTTTKVEEHQARWEKIVRDPALQELPYKVETNSQGQIILSPHRNKHSKKQRKLQKLLDEHAPKGEVFPEFAIATPKGVKSADVVWTSPQREREMGKTGDPTALAPEVCIEVLSESNTMSEIQEKRVLYRETGAEEVWIVEEDGAIRFFGEEELERSKLAPDMPKRVRP